MEPPPGLYRNASDELAESAEDVEIVSIRVRRRKLELEGELVEDQFEERARRRASEEAEARRLQAQQEQAESLQGKIAYTLEPRPLTTLTPIEQVFHVAYRIAPCSAAGLPSDAPPEVRLAVHAEVLKLLQSTDRRTVSDETLNSLIRAAVKYILRKHQEEDLRRRTQQQNDYRRSQMQALDALLGLFKQPNPQPTVVSQPQSAPSPPQITPPPPASPARSFSDVTSACLASERRSFDSMLAKLDEVSRNNRVSRLLARVGVYLQECEEAGDVDFEDHQDRIDTVKSFQDAIRPHLLKQVEEDPNVSDDDLRESIDELAKQYWDDFIEEED